MHALAQVTIRNFRSCQDACLPIAPFTPLVGVNNGGKSNILDSISWLLKPYALTESDFCDPSLPVVVEGVIAGITPNLLERLNDEHRRRISAFCAQGILTMRRTQFSAGATAKSIVLEVRDPNVQDSASEQAWHKNPTGIDAAIRALFPEPIEIGAMEDAASDVSASKSGTTIAKLIAELTQTVEAQHGPVVREALNAIRRRFDAHGEDRAPELDELDRQANDKLKDFFPGVRIRIHIPTPEIKELFRSGTIKVFEGDAAIGRDVTALGHGAQRSIQMALVRHLADIKTGADVGPRRTLLLIDEPELYLHPHAVEQVRSALQALSEGHYQVVFATHSPLMIGPEHIGNTLIIRKESDRGTLALPTLAHAISQVIADAPSQAQALFELNNSSQILFCDKALVVEGHAEQRLLPDIYLLIKRRTLAAAKIALVALGGVGSTSKCIRILQAMGISALGLADLDFAFRTAPKAGLLPEDDPDIRAFREATAKLSKEHGFALAQDGFPVSNNTMPAKDAFAVVARDPDAVPYVRALHSKLLTSGIWLWEEGTFEQCLGLRSTKEESLLAYRRLLHKHGCEATIPSLRSMVSFINWLDPADAQLD